MLFLETEVIACLKTRQLDTPNIKSPFNVNEILNAILFTSQAGKRYGYCTPTKRIYVEQRQCILK
jgi:hypothetical protein